MKLEEKDFFERCFGIVAGLEVQNEAQAIAKEVVLDEIENLQSQLKAKEETEKEFIKYLEQEIEKNRKEATCMVAYNNSVLPLKEILSKYYEILSKGENK